MSSATLVQNGSPCFLTENGRQGRDASRTTFIGSGFPG